MACITVALVSPGSSDRQLFANYMEESGLQVIQLCPDRTLERVLKERKVDVVVAHPGHGDGGTLRTTQLACRQIARPLIIVAAEGSEVERTLYLRMGAEDVVTPPFSMEEVVLRVRSVARRSQGGHASERTTWMLDSRELMLDEEKHIALLDNSPLRLTEIQWGILCYLSERWEAAVSRKQLMHHCLSYADEVYDRAVDTHIKNLRAKLGDGKWIETVRGYGYRLSWDIRKA
jgi:DNA-binding response OmpR family regulator